MEAVTNGYCRVIKEIVTRTNQLEEQISALSDAELAAKTQQFKQRLQEGSALDDLIPEAFAVVREAGRRVKYASF